MLELRCFGQVTVVDEAGTVCSLRSRKHVGLLLYLVAHARTTHTREDLSDLLWDGTGRRERHSLSQALYDIRSNGGDVLDLSTTTVRMRRDSVLYEAAQFERAVETRDHVKALDLYRGEFAPELAGLGAEVFDRWHDSERERCRVLASIALRNAQRAAEERGNWDRMCLAALRLIRMNEFDEEAHCALMRGLWMKGDPASALRHYRSLRPDRVAGWRTVRDLAERIESSGSVREVLTVPREPVELIGREEEFQTLYDAIRTHGARGATVVISGEPGVGRTALVTEFVRLASASGGSVGHLERANDTARGAWPRIVVVDGDAIPTTPPPIRLPNLMTLVTTTAVDRLWPEGDLQADVVLSLTRLEPQEVLRLVASRVSGITDSTADAAARLSGGNPALALKIAAVLVVRGLPAGGTSAEIEEAGRVALRSSSRLREIVEAWQKSLPQEAFDLARRVACLRPRTVEALYSLGALGAWGNGFSQLEDRGCLKFAAAGITMTPPITSLAFASTGDGRHAAFRRDAVAQLEGGSPAQRYAAATELADAGHRVEARRMLSQAARLASKEGDLETASRAGTLASVRALTPQERFETALLAAKAELGRGRPSQAERTLRTIQYEASSDSQRLEAELLLLRSLIVSEAQGEIAIAAVRVTETARRVPDERLRSLASLLVTESSFIEAAERGEPEQFDLASSQLEAALERSSQYISDSASQWLASFRTLFLSRVLTKSRSSAGALLSSFGPCLHEVRDFGGRMVADQARAVLEVRAGRLRGAQAMIERILKRDPPIKDRERAVALNNLGVILTELGQFVTARGVFEELVSIDHALRTSVADELYTLLNDAQAAWFMGDHLAAKRRGVLVLERAAKQGEAAVLAEAAALLGLCAFETGDDLAARRMSEKTMAAGPSLVGVHDKYLIAWLRALVGEKRGHDPSEGLLSAAENTEATDRLAALKLRALALQFRSEQHESGGICYQAIRDLRRNGSAWFVRRVAAVERRT